MISMIAKIRAMRQIHLFNATCNRNTVAAAATVLKVLRPHRSRNAAMEKYTVVAQKFVAAYQNNGWVTVIMIVAITATKLLLHFNAMKKRRAFRILLHIPATAVKVHVEMGTTVAGIAQQVSNKTH